MENKQDDMKRTQDTQFDLLKKTQLGLAEEVTSVEKVAYVFSNYPTVWKERIRQEHRGKHQ